MDDVRNLSARQLDALRRSEIQERADQEVAAMDPLPQVRLAGLVRHAVPPLDDVGGTAYPGDGTADGPRRVRPAAGERS